MAAPAARLGGARRAPDQAGQPDLRRHATPPLAGRGVRPRPGDRLPRRAHRWASTRSCGPGSGSASASSATRDGPSSSRRSTSARPTYCDLVGVLSDGELLMLATPEQLRRAAFGGDVHRRRGGPAASSADALADVAALDDVVAPPWEESPRQWRIVVDDADAAVGPLEEALRAQRRPGHRTGPPRGRLRRGVRAGDRAPPSSRRRRRGRRLMRSSRRLPVNRAWASGHPVLRVRAQGARRDRPPAAARGPARPRAVPRAAAVRHRLRQPAARAADAVRRTTRLVLRGRRRRVRGGARRLRRLRGLHHRRGRGPTSASRTASSTSS